MKKLGILPIPSLIGCHTQAKTMDFLIMRIKEAIELCLEVEHDIHQNEFIGIQKVSVDV